jgi:hypothetical protein
MRINLKRARARAVTGYRITDSAPVARKGEGA